MKTPKTLPEIEWPADFDPDAGWPDENTTVPDGSGRTLGDIASQARVHLGDVLRTLGKEGT